MKSKMSRNCLQAIYLKQFYLIGFLAFMGTSADGVEMGRKTSCSISPSATSSARDKESPTTFCAALCFVFFSRFPELLRVHSEQRCRQFLET